MHSIIVPIHSFIDVITNSSSETYITCNGKTIDVIKSVLKLFLENANIATPVDELFTVDLVYKWKDKDDENYVCEVISDYDEDGPTLLRVSLKDPTNPNFGELVKLMNKLNDAFTAEEFQC